ncbi:hypothetical protein EQP59_05850 [Ornithobacterium rhinotracheale]|uniref:Uncharacterized protein n=1 Tax=Ornithobacterium rhinotracheale TaxID=28251 RepID=A0A3R6AUL1_ORNRH|nr:hypothetical protein [Ornithobacterium rhinotracheale]QAR30887.1 hypothetical protein EQP59_05850 [Ornithobacterium rhinotracheale]
MHNNWKNQLKDKMNQREIKPDDALWNKIEQNLNTEKPKSSFWAYFSVAASVLLLILIGLGTYFYPEKSMPKVAIQNTSSAPSKGIEIQQVKPKITTKKTEIESETYEVQPKEKTQIATTATDDLAKKKALKNEILQSIQQIDDLLATHPELKDSLQKKSSAMRYVSAQELLASVENEKMPQTPYEYVNMDTQQLLAQVEDEILSEKSPQFLDFISKNLKKIHLAIQNKISK